MYIHVLDSESALEGVRLACTAVRQACTGHMYRPAYSRALGQISRFFVLCNTFVSSGGFEVQSLQPPVWKAKVQSSRVRGPIVFGWSLLPKGYSNSG